MNWWVKCSEQTKAFANMTMALKAENPGLILKPFPTCETCDHKEEHYQFPDGEFIWCNADDTTEDSATKHKYFFCKSHQGFNTDNEGNDGKDM